ncbi:hypothetical protein CcCBS67573_g00737 [Chytriomyces confervae]|uniref:Reelin domain-containing protein n=1 Tax=Chytriomyces confervae TaxID=246404 RepID=A0A507FNX8_9FUNG|nr:hypothetical protein CcCBS67573_g00737 [Chytriomyces confervae]
MQLIQAVSLLSFAALSLAFPNGAPRCKITESIISAGHKIPQGSLGLVMQLPASYTPGGPAIPITVTAANGTAVSFQGMLAYLTPNPVQDSSLTAVPVGTPNVPFAGGAPQHVGTFTNIAAQNLRPQTAAICSNQNVTNDNAASTITHAQPLTGQTPFTVMWTPPAANVGPVTVNMVISSGSSRTPWQIIPSGLIQSTAGPGNPNASAPSSATVTTAATAATASTTAATTTTTTTKGRKGRKAKKAKKAKTA